MADSFFGFASDMPSLGAGTLTSLELLTADVDDEYDALNDETFGNAMDGDWEEGHEQLAQLEGVERDPDTVDIEHTISQLVLEDDLDDPAIMGMSRAKPPYQVSDKRLFRSSSPPTSSVIESNCIGSPATSSIWTSPKREEEREDSLLAYLRENQQRPISDLASEDPCVITDSSIRRAGVMSQHFPRVMTVGELERGMLSADRPPPPTGACLLEDVERNILTKTLDRNNVSPARPIPTANKLISGFGIRASPPRSQLSPPSSILPPHGMPAHPGLTRPIVPHNLYVSRFVPPQLTSIQRLPYQHQFGNNRPPLLMGQIGFLPHMPPGVKGPPLLGPTASGQNYPPRLPMLFGEPRGIRRFPGPGQHPMFQNAGRQWPGQQYPMHVNNYWPLPQESWQPRENMDEYAGLMTQKEKDWLVKIQLMQLQSDNPYLYDYYYTAFTLKQRTKGGKEGWHEQEPSLLLPERSKVETRAYEPVRFVGSLGKLQAASVYNPRKMIDVDAVHPDEGDGEQAKLANKELRKLRQCLMEIEKLYSTLLETDDIDKRAAALPADARANLYEVKGVLVRNIIDGYLRTTDSFVQMVSIRKGRNLLRRTLPLLSKEQYVNITKAALGNLRAISKRDANEQMVSQLLAMLANPVTDCDLPNLVHLARVLVGPRTVTDADTPPDLVETLENRFASEFLFFILDRAEQLYRDSCVDTDRTVTEEWSSIVTRVADGVLLSRFTARSDSSLDLLMPHFARFSVDPLRLDALRARLDPPKERILTENVT